MHPRSLVIVMVMSAGLMYFHAAKAVDGQLDAVEVCGQSWIIWSLPQQKQVQVVKVVVALSTLGVTLASGSLLASADQSSSERRPPGAAWRMAIIQRGPYCRYLASIVRVFGLASLYSCSKVFTSSRRAYILQLKYSLEVLVTFWMSFNPVFRGKA
jgi:hypothetical protein